MIELELYDKCKKKGLLVKDSSQVIDFIPLSKIEFDIIVTIAGSGYSYCKYLQLLNNIHEEVIITKDIKSYLPTLRVNINRINKKLKPYAKIQNIYGRGYRLI